MMKRGSRGVAVKRLQAMVGAPATGAYDPRTEAMVKQAQRRLKIKPDGVVGPITWPLIVEQVAAAKRDALWSRVSIERVDLPRDARLDFLVGAEVSYAHLRLRSSTAAKLRAIIDELAGSGVTLTTSGGMRSLRADVGRARSSTSMHYLGRAFDLGVYTGGVDPNADPFFVVKDQRLASARRFRVFANASNLDHPLVGMRRFKAMSTKARGFVSVQTAVVDITALFERHGLKGIGAREWAWGSKWSWDRHDFKGLEWWHWQDEEGLEAGLSTFGDELLTVHGYERAASAPPWAHAGEFFGEGWR